MSVADSKKTVKSVKLSGIPDELKGYPQWVVWRYEQYKGDKKPRKVPYSPLTTKKTGTRAIDSGNWGTIEQAVQTAKTIKGRFDGIGFVFSTKDPFVGVDIDHCIVDGAPSSLAREIIEKLQSFTEISPSGNGVHIIFKGKKLGTRCKRKLDENQEIEIYDRERYFTVTGKQVADSSALINQNQQAFEELYQKYVEQLTDNKPPKKNVVKKHAASVALSLSDSELLAEISKSKQAAEFDQLFSGDMSAYGNDHSKADMKLCYMLAFWTTKNRNQMDRIFRMSGLMREKWDSKRRDTTYGWRTIDTAIENTDSIYTPKGRRQDDNVIPIENGKKKSRKMRSCHMMESPIQPAKPLYDPNNHPWPDIGSYYWINPITGDLHVGGTDSELGEIIAQNPIWIHARSKDLYGEFSLVVKFFNYDHKEITVSFPTTILSDSGGIVGKILRAQGMPLIAGKEKMVNRYLDQMAKWCEKTGWTAEKIGWFEGTNPPCFVMPEVVLGKADTEQEVFYQPVLQQDAKSLTSKGTLRDWKEYVAQSAKKNPLLLFGVLAGLAGPLNKLAKGETGGFHFCGDTSTGKTAVAQGAATVWGDGSDPATYADRTSIRKWKATVNGLEAYAQLHNDIILCLDEIGGTKPEYVSEAIYLLTGGVPKGRSQVEGGIRKQPTWHNILLSTGELTIEQVMRSAKQEQKGGQRHRLPDIRCDTNEGGVVADPDYKTREERGDFVSKYKENCSQFYGTAGPAFVSWISAQISKRGLQVFVDELQGNVRKFEENIKQDLDLPSEGRRMLKRLSIIGVAGLYASEIGIMDIVPHYIHDAVVTVRDLWINEMDAELSEVERTLNYFKHQVLTNMSRFKSCNEYEAILPSKLLGYQNIDYIMILAHSMDELCGMHPKSTVLRELEKQNKLVLGEMCKRRGRRRPDKKASIPYFKERPRCYHIHRDFFE